MVRQTDISKFGNNQRNSDDDIDQPLRRKPELGKVYVTTIASPTLLRQYAGDLSLCSECNYHQVGACRELICKNWCRKGHTTKFFRRPTCTPNQGTGISGNRNFYEYGRTNHFKRDSSKMRNQGGNARGRAFFIGTNDATQCPDGFEP